MGAQPAEVIAAFDRLAAELRTRYLMTFPTPQHLPATAVVRVDTPGGPLTVTADVPAASAPDLSALPTPLALTLALGILVLLATAATALVGYRAGRVAGRPPSETVRPTDPARTARPQNPPPGAGPSDSPPDARPEEPAPNSRLKEPTSSARPPDPPPKARGADRQPAGATARSTPAAGARAGNIPARQDAPVARTPLLVAVRDALHRGKPVVLQGGHGQSGTGTTSAMIEFAHRYSADYDIAWWVPAEDPELIPDRLAELAEALGLARRTDPAEAATARLFEALRQRDRWLIVFDDAESPRELARFLPAGPGHVVITSPDPGWHELATALTIPSFTRAESVGLLQARRPDLGLDAAALAATALDGLPLALDPASALLAETGMSVETFLRLLGEHRAPAGGEDGPAATAATAATWMVALDRLAADDPGALALLTLVAWLGPEPMPLSLLARNPDTLPAPVAGHLGEPGALAERAETLRRRRLARVGPDSLQLHRFPAGLLLARTAGERTDGDGWATSAVRLLRAGLPAAASHNPATWPAWRPPAAARTGRHRSGAPARSGRRRRGLAAQPGRRLPAGAWATTSGPSPRRGRARALPPTFRGRASRHPRCGRPVGRRPQRSRPGRAGVGRMVARPRRTQRRRLLHGYAEHLGLYDTLTRRLVADGHAVHAMDAGGHGRSDGERAVTRHGTTT